MKQKILILLTICSLATAGCVVNVKKDSTVNTKSGLFRSEDLGQTWQHTTTLYTTGGKTLNFNGSNITALAFDPNDAAAIYLGSQVNGIFYSYNYGAGWFNTLTDKGTINSIAVDPIDKCTIYAAAKNIIFKSTDCSRTWQQIYFETLPNQNITNLAIKTDDHKIVYATTSGGSFLRSQDYGFSWDVLKRFNDNPKYLIVLNNTDSNIIYVALQNKGIFRSTDGGFNWDDLAELPVKESEVADPSKVRKFKEVIGKNSAILAFNRDLSVSDGIIYVNKTGIFRLQNADTWQQIKLLTPKGKDTIYSVTVNPKNTQEIFYGTALAIYHSIDNGLNWSVSNLPSSATAKLLEFSLDNRFLYLGAYYIKK